MTHNTPALEPDKTLAERLAIISAKATDENLTDNGRYFSEFCQDLTSCGHGETGEFGNKADGKLIETMWNAYRSGQLITLAEAQAMVAAEEEEWRCELSSLSSFLGTGMGDEKTTAKQFVKRIEWAFDYHVKVAAIRAAATGTKEGE